MQPNSEPTDDNYFIHQEIKVDPGQSPVRIDKFLMDRLMNVSRNRIQNALKAGAILVNDKNVKSNYKVRPLDTLSLILPDFSKDKKEVIPQEIPLDILYEDDHLMIINKQAGLVVHPGVGNWDGTLVNGLTYYLKNKDIPVLDGNTPDRAGLVHRIDKNTTGLLVIAKDDFTMTALGKQFFDHSIERSYWALVWGQPEQDEGTIEAHIGRHQRFRHKMHAYPEGEIGKHAITHYKVIEPMYYVSLIECRLETGRTHQIRVHMAHLGHPIFGDAKYGGDSIRKGTIYSKYKRFVENCMTMMPRQALHARTLGFIHPVTEQKMHFEAPLPSDFESVMDKWRNYVNTRREL